MTVVADRQLVICISTSALICVLSTGITGSILVATEMVKLEELLLLLVGNNILAALLNFAFWYPRYKYREPIPAQELLHFDPAIPRRGLGDLILKVNHVAFIVSDVGRSLAFYTEVIGFQQIQRPNFDRHGAWLTMGNTELHLIKGVPNAPTGKDLIVSHMALETNFPEQVLGKLIEMDVPFRQNISVPDPKKARENLVECFENADGKVTQYFIRDPDGYYLELCNCDILTKFCLFKENERKKNIIPLFLQLMNASLMTYNESGQGAEHALRCPLLFKVGVVIVKQLSRARKSLLTDYDERLKEALATVTPTKLPDDLILANFMNRQKTYCDVTQGFSQAELIEALCAAGNTASVALLILGSKRKDTRIWKPPQYLLSEGGTIKQQTFEVKKSRSLHAAAFGTRNMFKGKSFYDNLPSMTSAMTSTKSAKTSTMSAMTSESSFREAQYRVARKRSVLLSSEDEHESCWELASSCSVEVHTRVSI